MKKPSKLKPSSSKIQYEESDEEIKSSLDEEEDEEEVSIYLERSLNFFL